MNGKGILAIFAGLSLFLPLTSFDAFAAFEPDRRIPTVISLDLIEQCINTMTCNAEIFTGETVTFTGMLTEEGGMPLKDKEIQIVALLPDPKIVTLTTTTTNIDGMFTAEWTAALLKPKTDFSPSGELRSESLEIFAVFPGDEELAPSRSGKQPVTLSVNSIHTFVNSDKNLYNEGDTVTIFIAFIDSNDNFVDPDNIRATWNNQSIELEKKQVGSYTFMIENLEKKHQQIIVVPSTEGFNTRTAYLTIIVAGLR